MKTLRILPLIIAVIALTGCSGESPEPQATTLTETSTVTTSQSPTSSTPRVPADFTKVDASNACTEKIVEVYQPTGQPPTYRINGEIEEMNGGWYMEGIVVWSSGEEPSDFECIAKPGTPPVAAPVVHDYRTLNNLVELIQEG